jgi:hypothetical protein
MLEIALSSMKAVWNTFAGGSSTEATEAASGEGTFLTSQSPSNLLDGRLTSRFSSRGSPGTGTSFAAGRDTGFVAILLQCTPILTGVRMGNAFPYVERDPLRMTIEGSNCNDLLACNSWSLLYSGLTGLGTLGNVSSYGTLQSFSNTNVYKSYRFLMTTKRASSSFVAYSEIELYGYSNQTAGTGSGPFSGKYFRA